MKNPGEIAFGFALEPKSEILIILSKKAPVDALEIFQQLKFIATKQLDERAAKIKQQLPPWMRMSRDRIEPPTDFHYDAIVEILKELVNEKKIQVRENGKGDEEYSLPNKVA